MRDLCGGGPSFFEWVVEAGYRRVGEEYVKNAAKGVAIHENDYLPRYLLGEYLSYVYGLLASDLPARIRLIHHRQWVIDVIPTTGERYKIVVEDGSTLLAHFVVLTTGHSENQPNTIEQKLARACCKLRVRNPKLKYFRTVYPTTVLNTISADDVVGVQGMGLSTYDVLSELTLGRGGRFDAQPDGQLLYVASGQEPHMILFSRQGLPYCSHGINQKGIDGRWKACFFTNAFIDSKRQCKLAASGSRQLDFAHDLWPTLKKEMGYVHAMTRHGIVMENKADYQLAEEDECAINTLMSPFGEGYFFCQDDYQAAVLHYLSEDLMRAERGNVFDPLKAATDVLRDIRDNIRYAVDFGGLTPESHRDFLMSFCPVMNRIIVGPPKRKNQELLALLSSGIVSLGPGVAPVMEIDEQQARFVLHSTRLKNREIEMFDVLVQARVEIFYPEQDKHLIMRNMLASGLIRPYRNGNYHPGGIDINRHQNVIARNGKVVHNVWALGIPVEGPHFFTFVLPRPFINARSIQDAGKCALQILNRIQAWTQAGQQHAAWTKQI